MHGDHISIPTHYFFLTAAKTLLPLRIQNITVTTWCLRISKKSSTASTLSHNENIRRSAPSVARTVTCHLTTLSPHRHPMIRHRIPQNLLDRTAHHLQYIHQSQGHHLLHHRLLTTVFPNHHHSFPALTLHFWAKKTLMIWTFNIWKYEQSWRKLTRSSRPTSNWHNYASYDGGSMKWHHNMTQLDNEKRKRTQSQYLDTSTKYSLPVYVFLNKINGRNKALKIIGFQLDG